MNDTLHSFIKQLDEHKIHYQLSSVRPNYIMVTVSVPGERWEIEFSANNDIEVEIYKSDGNIHGKELLRELFKRFSD